MALFDGNNPTSVTAWIEKASGEDVFPILSQAERETITQGTPAEIVNNVRAVLLKKIAMPDLRLGDLTITAPRELFQSLLHELNRVSFDEEGQAVEKVGGFYHKGRSDGT